MTLLLIAPRVRLSLSDTLEYCVLVRCETDEPVTVGPMDLSELLTLPNGRTVHLFSEPMMATRGPVDAIDFSTLHRSQIAGVLIDLENDAWLQGSLDYHHAGSLHPGRYGLRAVARFTEPGVEFGFRAWTGVLFSNQVWFDYVEADEVAQPGNPTP